MPQRCLSEGVLLHADTRPRSRSSGNSPGQGGTRRERVGQRAPGKVGRASCIGGRIMGDSSQETSGLAKGVVGSARVTAFGTSIVAPAASVITALVVMVFYAGFASPLIVLITFAGSLCCAFSIAEFARRVPSAGWSYTYNSRGLGRTVGFLTGWMMVFGYAMFVPGGVALTSTYASILVADEAHVTIAPWVLFPVIVAAAVLLAYLGIRT